MTIQTRLDEIDSRVKAATPGPWIQNFMHVVRPLGSDGAHWSVEPEIADLSIGEIHSVPFDNHTAITEKRHIGYNGRVSYNDNAHKNAELIAHAPEDLARLSAALRVAIGSLQEVASQQSDLQMIRNARTALDSIERILSEGAKREGA